ncbi:MAG TPA: hypothetical protein VN604_06835 [Nitrospirota bacterium]|nr:hypothetical protein [Nitrospirota bacterium]
MVARYQKTTDPGGLEEKKTAERQAGRDKDEACRCKEVSAMPPRKLFGLMLSDLAFWRKAKKA